MLRIAPRLTRLPDTRARHARFASSASNGTFRRLTSSKLLPFFGAAAIGTTLLFFNPAEKHKHRYDDLRPAQSRFVVSKVVESHSSGADTRIIKLKAPPGFKGTLGSIWSIFIKDDDIQVERPYTPLEGVDSEGNMLFWIKRYEHGEVGRWLHSKQPGDSIEFRGPLQTWKWQDDEWDEVIMISGGTGITPFYQLFHSVISRGSSPKTRFTLLHSSPGIESLPPDAILGPLKKYSEQIPDRFRLHLFVDNAPSAPSAVTVGRIDKQKIASAAGLQKSLWQRLTSSSPINEKKVLVLVCGPQPMISAIAGPYGRNYSQGPVGGALKELGFPSDSVYKL